MGRKDGKPGRIAQIRQTYTITKQGDPRIGLVLASIFVGIIVLFVAVGLLTKLVMIFIPLSVPAALLATLIVFGRRAETAAYAQIEGEPGAAGAALKAMRGAWFVTPAVAATKNQDLVHRAIGRPGVVLVSEGPPARVANLLANERRRTARFVPDIPIIEIQCGSADGQVPLRKLSRMVMKLPKTLRPAQVTEVRKRLEALANHPVPIPKGPMPRSPRAARTQQRGR